MISAMLVLALAGLTSVGHAASPAGIRLEDLEGRPAAALPDTSGTTAVFVFTGLDCPIANRYAPELRRIHDRYAGAAVRFWLVYAEPGATPEAIRRHAGAFGYGFAALRDPRHDLVRLAGARVTPEAAVFVGGAEGPRLVYRGRIDDRNVAFGRTRPVPRTHDLEDVLAALASGQAVAPRTTTAIGCSIPPLE